jgi:hypothetical protein
MNPDQGINEKQPMTAAAARVLEMKVLSFFFF